MKIKILFLLIIIFIPTISIAQSEVLNKQEILQSQQSSLNISSFIQEAQEYSSNVYKDINELPDFKGISPSSEVLWNSIYEKMKEVVPQISKISIWETATSCASYFEEE